MGHLNSAQRNKANPDFKVEGKQMDTNAQRIQIRNSYFCTFKFKHPRKSVVGINSVGRVEAREPDLWLLLILF